MMKSHEIAEQLEHISFIDPLAGKRLANKAWVAVEDIKAFIEQYRQENGEIRIPAFMAVELDALLAHAQETTP